MCWNLIPDSLDQVESQMNSNAIYYFEFQTWNVALLLVIGNADSKLESNIHLPQTVIRRSVRCAVSSNKHTVE